MALKFITNTVYRDAAKIQRNGASIYSGQIYNLIGGPVYLGYGIQHTSDANHLIYQRNDDYILTADTCVVGPGAITLLDDAGFKISYLDEVSGWVDIEPNEVTSGSAFGWAIDSSILVGPYSDCFCLTFDKISDASAYRFKWIDSTPDNDLIIIQKLIFSESFEFGDTHNIERLTFERKNHTAMLNHVAYICDYTFSIEINNASREDLRGFKQDQYKPLEDPIFIYDSTEVYLPSKLWHAIITEMRIDAIADDLFRVTLSGSRLKHYQNYITQL